MWQQNKKMTLFIFTKFTYEGPDFHMNTQKALNIGSCRIFEAQNKDKYDLLFCQKYCLLIPEDLACIPNLG